MKAFNASYKTEKEPLAHAAAWTAVKRSFKQSGGKWVAKESAQLKEVELSDENKRQLLQTALTAEYQLTKDQNIPSGTWVQDVFEDYLIYSVNDQSYKITYELGEDGTTTFGKPEKVVRQIVYQPMEALQVVYSDIVMEAGRRNASLDSARIKKIVEICQELLSNEGEIDVAKVKKATKEADEALSWLKDQPLVLELGGVKYLAESFAYTPDLNDPNTWRLLINDAKGLNMASAYLSPGGYAGQKMSIEESALPEVKRKIRNGYRSIEWADSNIPKWVMETETREHLNSFVSLAEATLDKGKAQVIVIKPGFNASEDRYYPAEMLKRDYKVFEGQKMYADHPTKDEDSQRPERSIKDWVATLSEVKVDADGVVTGTADILESWLMEKLASLRDKDMLSEMGISINAIGSASKSTIDGKSTLVIEKLVAARSVDFVTEPGAGGIVTFYEADRSSNVDLIDLITLKEKRPDIIELITTEVRNEFKQEGKHIMENEAKIKELEGQVATLTTDKANLETENTGLKDKITEAEKKEKIAEAQALVKDALDKAVDLPEAAKERVIEKFKDAETADGIQEAIDAEKAYIARLSEAGKVKNLGNTKTNDEESAKALRESFKRANPEWTDEMLDSACSGK